MPRKATKVRRRRTRANNPPHPPRIPITVCLIVPLAEGLKEIADRERASLSRIISDALEDYYGSPRRPR